MFSGTDKKTHLLRTPVYAEFIDEDGYVAAGHVLKLIDISGSEAALRYMNRNGNWGVVVTASLDRTNFVEPIRMGEIISLESRVSQVWKSSMETQVRVRADNLFTGKSRDIATSYLVFVALDPKTRRKIELPPLNLRSYEDCQLARSADIRKKNRLLEDQSAPYIPIEPADNPVVTTQTMTEADANAQSNVFGGIILSIIHETARKAAKRQALSGAVVGVRQDRMSFVAPTFIGETVEAKAIITKTWNTSMELQVEVDAINPETGQRRRVANSYLVYVRLGGSGRPADVPPWAPQTEAQKQRAERAEWRRQIRKQEEEQARRFSSALPTPIGLKERFLFTLSRLKERFLAIVSRLKGSA